MACRGEASTAKGEARSYRARRASIASCSAATLVISLAFLPVASPFRNLPTAAFRNQRYILTVLTRKRSVRFTTPLLRFVLKLPGGDRLGG